jgi:hypothetical protein
MGKIIDFLNKKVEVTIINIILVSFILIEDVMILILITKL